MMMKIKRTLFHFFESIILNLALKYYLELNSVISSRWQFSFQFQSLQEPFQVQRKELSRIHADSTELTFLILYVPPER